MADDFDPSRVEAVLFDLGGVLIEIDFDLAIEVWAARAAHEPAALRGRFSMDSAYARHERGELHVTEYWDALRASLGVELADEDLLAGWNAIFLEPVEGMPELVAATAAVLPVYSFTNSNPTHQEVWEVRLAEQLHLFRSIFVSSDLGVRKPDPHAYEVVAQHMGVAPAAVLFFDDSAANVAGARAAGMQAIRFRTVEDARAPLARLGVRTAGGT